jgi:hypothetical protein
MGAAGAGLGALGANATAPELDFGATGADFGAVVVAVVVDFVTVGFRAVKAALFFVFIFSSLINQ